MNTSALAAAVQREIAELRVTWAMRPQALIAIGVLVAVLGAIQVAGHRPLSGAATLPVGYLSTLQEPVALLGAIYIAQALGPAVARFALLLLTAVLVPAGFLTPEVPTIEVAGFAAFVAITLAAVRTIGHWRLYPAQAANTGS